MPCCDHIVDDSIAWGLLKSTVTVVFVVYTQTGVIETLLACGANINHRDQHGWTALMAGIAENNPAAGIRTLLRHGVDTSVRALGSVNDQISISRVR